MSLHALLGLQDTKRKKKKKVCVGVILELGESETNVKYEDGRTKRVANTRLRPLERVTRDATGYSGDSSFNVLWCKVMHFAFESALTLCACAFLRRNHHLPLIAR
eukprot:s359_g41.t1